MRRAAEGGYTENVLHVKISGITNWADASAAVDAGADALGFVCDANSPRLINLDAFLEIAARLPPHVQRVGVFGTATDSLWRTAGHGAFSLFHQIQYTHDSLWTEIVRENWDMRRKIREFALISDQDLRQIAGNNGLVQAFLLNVHAPEGDEYGWELAREVHQFGKRLYLAGGLTPENVAQAAARVRPYAVDVTVGVESKPGVKNHAKMRAFVRAARGEG
jgi:phosphoribosylanthranilate isomerase